MSSVIEEDRRDRFSTTDKREKSLLELIGIPASILAILATAAVYGAGAAFRAGYLYQFGFDSTQIPTDFHDTLYWGYARGTPLVFAWLVYGIVALALIAILYWAAAAFGSRIRKWRVVRQLSARVALAEGSRSTPIKLIAVAVLVSCFLYLLFLSFLAMGELYEYGVKRGKDRIDDFEANATVAAANTATQWIEISFSSPTPRVERGYRLLCTQDLCSIYDPVPERKGVRLMSLEGMSNIRIFPERPLHSQDPRP